jgi:hypothetical protein
MELFYVILNVASKNRKIKNKFKPEIQFYWVHFQWPNYPVVSASCPYMLETEFHIPTTYS